MNEIDSKGTGEIDFESFVLTVTKKVQTSLTLEELRHAFGVYFLQLCRIDTYDDCHDGTISMKSLMEVFTKYSKPALSREGIYMLIKTLMG